MKRFTSLSLALLASAALLAALPAGAWAGKGTHNGAHAAKARANAVVVRGTIVSWTASTVTVAVKGGANVTVGFTGQTRFRVNGQASTAPSFTAKALIVAVGRRNSDGSVTARGIAVGMNPNRPIFFGTILGIGNGTLTIASKVAPTATVTLSNQTRFFVGRTLGTTAPTFAMGQHIFVVATRNADGSYAAQFVAVVANRKDARAALKAWRATVKASATSK